jgi:uncharacterized membrane protein HdeD (DUF308 family)
MKTIRLIAGILLVVTGVLHITGFIKAPDDPGSIGMLTFGIIYAVIGLLLFTKKLYPVYLGLVLPIAGMTIALIKFGFPPLKSMMALLVLIDVAVIICCAWVLVKRKNT